MTSTPVAADDTLVRRPFYDEPVGILTGSTAIEAIAEGSAHRLAGGPVAFTHIRCLRRNGPTGLVPVTEINPDELTIFTAPRPDFAGMDLARPRIMGIVNVTPDSFSDGGDAYDPDAAIARALTLVDEGADIVDIGGESTRPGAEPVSPEEEWRRVGPVVEALARNGLVVSIDTRNALVMERAVKAGAAIVNDVSGLTHDPRALPVVAEAKVPVFLMHMRGDPETMNRAPHYEHVLLDVFDELERRVHLALDAGLTPDLICIDPGIGFAKNSAHNQAVMQHLALYHGLGLPILLGASRKGLVGRTMRGETPKQRLPSSLAAALRGVASGVQFLRVHDVAETVQALTVWQAISTA